MIDRAAELLRTFAGLDTESEHGNETATRFLQMLNELTKCKSSGNKEEDKQHIQNCIKWKTFDTTKQDMIIIDGITFVSLCNHHLIPFMGEVHIGYVPNKHIIGLSKAARVVQHFARQLQIQEQMTDQIADYLEKHLTKPKGVAVLVRAEHMCMTIRGAQSPGVKTTTSTMRGVFGEHERTAKAEFMQIISGRLR